MDRMFDRNRIAELFVFIDMKNTERFASCLSADCSFRFGNMPAVVGVDSISEFVSGFFDSIAALKHDVTDIWMLPDGAVCHGMVSYTRHDQSVLSVPFSNIFKVDNGEICEYLVFADTSQLYAE